MAILALDIATVTGWALHEPGLENPLFGTLRLPNTPDEVAKPMEALRRFLRDKQKMWNFTEIVVEEAHIPTPKWDPVQKKMVHKMDKKTIFKLICLAGMAEWFADQVGARCYDVNIATWRKHFLGHGALGSEKSKTKALAVCQNLGWNTVEVDAAEACGILDYYLSCKADYPRPWRDRMLAGGLVT